MKILKNVELEGQAVKFIDEKIVLALNDTGRGFITVKTEQPCVGKRIEFELGEEEDYHCWFMGFVENEHPAQNGWKRLFIRENVAILERTLNCSHRHITLAELCEWLEKETGLEFIYPDEAYSTAPIPNFNHTGNGFQLLNNIGRLFKIADFVWFQNTDGSVFVGAWEDSQWAENEIELDNKHTTAQTATVVEIPVDASIRPGTLLNGKRAKTITLEGDSYRIEWQDLDSKGKPLQKSPQRQAMEREFPELAGGYHLPKMAKVVAVADPPTAGDYNDPFRPKYAVDIQMLDEDGNEDNSVEVFAAVPLPVTSTGSQGGDFAFPEVGTLVEVGFMHGRPDRPFIRTLFAEGKTLPAVKPGEILRQQRPEVFERTDSAGNMHKETDQSITEKSFNRSITADSETKNLGKATKNVEGDEQKTVGGNKTTHVLGDNDNVTAGNKSEGVGGNYDLRIVGIASLISKSKAEIKAPKVWLGKGSRL